MAITREYLCIAHGDFDGKEPVCPHGCKGDGMVERAFRTPPMIQGAGMRRMDNTLDTLAREHGLSNMNNRLAKMRGTGMRRADADTYRRLNSATEMIIGNSRANLSGTDAGAFFKPLNDWGMVGASAQSALRKTGLTTVTDSNGVPHTYGSGDTVNDAGVTLGAPKATLEAAPFDGSKLGVPSVDMVPASEAA